MKKLLYSLLLWLPMEAIAQSFEGIWTGQVANQSASLQSEMTIKKYALNQLEGELVVTTNGIKDVYLLKATYTDNTAKGKLTYKTDGTVFDFSMTLRNNELYQNIAYQGQTILEGKYTRPAKTASSTTTNAKPDNLYRDPKLIGKWVHSENYSSNGGFYGGIQSAIVLNADGTLDDGGSTSYASGGGNSVMNKGDGNQTIAQLKALQARWFTKGNIFCWRVVVNGKTTDVENSRYYVENGALLMTDLQTGKRTLYQRQ